MKHYTITTVDSKSGKTITFKVYGKLSKIDININGNIKTVVSIVNEYNIPLYIETINTIDISESEYCIKFFEFPNIQ